MQIESETKLDFNDVLIKPKRSQAISRSDVDLKRNYKFLNCNSNIEFDVGCPIIAANMDAIGTFSMARVLSKFDVWTALHKFYKIDEIQKFYTEEVDVAKRVFYSTGTNEQDLEKLKKISDLHTELKFICIDVANGYTQKFVDKCKQIREWFPDSVLLAGNVCTAEMVQELLIAGKVDIVKIGIGSGKSCITRHITGVGYPQLSAIIECADAAHGLGGHICADGGCRTPGDIAKSFAAGADFSMIGGMFAGHIECDGDFTYDESGNKIGMVFYGMSSDTAMIKHHGGKAVYRASEGATMKVPFKGSISQTIEQILGGLRSTCTYVGTNKLKDISKCTTFVKTNRVHDMNL